MFNKPIKQNLAILCFCVLVIFSLTLFCPSVYGVVKAGEFHTADRNQDKKINLSELLRVIQFYNIKSYHCDPNGEDGYNPGPGDQTCEPHDSDYEPTNPWKISLIELLRLVQFYNLCGYELSSTPTEDGYKPVYCYINEGELEGSSEGSSEGSLEGVVEGILEGEGTVEGEGEVYTYARIVIDRRDTTPGSEINIPLYLETEGVSLNYIRFDLTFNYNRLQYLDFMEGTSVYNAGKTLTAGEVTPGKLRLTASGSTSKGMVTGSFAVIRFKISEDADFNDIYSIYAESIQAYTYPEGLVFPLSILAGYIRIYSSYPYPPVARFSATPTKNLVNSEIEFRDESRMGNGANATWQWSFGDGGFSVLRSPLHAYTSPGVYTVTLTVITSAGQSTEQKVGYIEILEGTRIYVKKPLAKEEVEPDGLTWATAFPTIQEGIDKAYELGGGEVWVAGGTYDELRQNYSGALIMRELVSVYGGFLGNETELNQRDYQLNLTVIDGSASRGGQPAWHVVVGENYSELNGFLITGGNCQLDNIYSDAQDGAGVYVPGKKFVVKNCTIYNNKAVGVGAGICCISGKLSLHNCSVVENKIENITSASAYNYGAGMYAMDSVLTIDNCEFRSNQISTKGIWQTSNRNIEVVASGGGIFAYNSDLSINYSTFDSNSCVAEGIGDGNVGGVIYGAVAKAFGGSIYIWFGNMKLQNSIFKNNTVSTNDHSGFSKASAGMLYMTRSSGKIINTIVFRNKAYDFTNLNERTGGIHIDLCENIVFSNCTMYGNQTDSTLSNHGGAVFNYYSNARFANTIIWSNSGLGTYSKGNDATFLYCDTQQVKNGDGNISSDPLFVFATAGNLRLSASSPCIDRGMDTSGEEWGNVLTDIDGNIRGFDAIPSITGDGSDYDMGAYEY
ncbi:MAG: PKD domain-containing protein [Candidatus Hydrogenedens sp.]|nr:PKD domain-containing protein [Candidatus Hydrogenedens sp.]